MNKLKLINKNNGIEVDDIGIISFFFTDNKILSMSINIIDNKISTDMLHQAHADYSGILHAVIDKLNSEVLSVMVEDCNLENNADDYYQAVNAIKKYCAESL